MIDGGGPKSGDRSPEPSGTSGGSLAPLALSTMYAQRFPGAIEHDLTPFFDAGRAMGFERFELSHILSPEAVERVIAARPAIETVHHPCPAGTPLMPGDTFTSEDREARSRAAEGLVRSIDIAARLGARFVVLHLGPAPDPGGEIGRLGFELVARVLAGGGNGERAERARERLRERLDAVSLAALERAGDALEVGMERARRLGIRLGVETGYHPHDLPDPTGLRTLLEQTDPVTVGAWLDTGHVGARAAMGMADVEAWMTAAGDRWLGAHVHDLVGLRDHLAPGSGRLEFGALLGALPAAAALTCEVDWYLDPSEVEAGARFVIDILSGTPRARENPRSDRLP